MPEEGGDVFDYNLPEAWEAGPSVHYSKASKKNMKCLKMTNNDVLIQIVGISSWSISKALEVNILNHSVMPLILFFSNFTLKKSLCFNSKLAWVLDDRMTFQRF